MTKTRIVRVIAIATLILGLSPAFAPAAEAAPECRGATGIVQCWPERVRECVKNLALPPEPC
jgi:hypothetical protein